MKQTNNFNSSGYRWRTVRGIASATYVCAILFFCSIFAFPAYADDNDNRNIMREIFSDIGLDTDLNPEDKATTLPYRDGATFRSVREPLFGSICVRQETNGSITKQETDVNGYFGKGGKLNSPPTSTHGYNLQNIGNSPFLSSSVVSVGGKNYSFEMLSILDAYEGDFDGDGKRDQLAFLVGARTKGTNTSRANVLLLCVGDAIYSSALTVVSVLYESSTRGKGELFLNSLDWIGRAALICADVDGNGVDEIITATPVNKYSTNLGLASDDFVKQANAMIWSVKAGSKGSVGWKNNSNWNAPKEVASTFNNMQNGGGHIGGIGTTVSLAAGDINRDGREDVVFALSCINIGFSDITQKASMSSLALLYGNKLTNSITASYGPHFALGLVGAMYRSVHGNLGSGMAANPQMPGAIGVTVADLDGYGQPSILVAYKEINAYGGVDNINYFDAQRFVVNCLDYKSGYGFSSSQIKRGGLSYRNLNRLKPLQTNAMNIAALSYNYGNNTAQYAVSSGSFVLDGVIYSFVRKLNGGQYNFETKYEERVVPNVVSPNPYDPDDPLVEYMVPNEYYYDNSAGYDKLWHLKPEWVECIPNYDDNSRYQSVTKIRSASVTGKGNGFIFQYLTSGSRFEIKYYDCINSAGTQTKHKSGQCFVKNYSPALQSKASSFVAFPDLDNDGVWLTYQNKHQFFWSDPVIVAALASPPYFNALPSDNWTNSTTSYGTRNSSSSGNSSSFTTTTGTVIATEVSAGILGVSGKWETEQESTKAMTSEAEKMTEIAHTSSFSTVGGENTVVLTTAAYDAYLYKIHYPNEATGQTTSSDFTVLVPRGGASALKVASVNYEDYEEMSSYAKGTLPDLSKMFKHTVGKPGSYPTSQEAAISEISVAPGSTIISQSSKSFPANSGSQSLGIEITKTNTNVTATSYSITTKNGGGFNSDGDFLDFIGIGSSFSTSSVYGTENEYGKITSNAVGVSFDGEVYGQNDGINASGTGLAKADFNWRLLRYIYSNRAQASASNGAIALQEFPVITYIVPSVTEPVGVIPSKVVLTLPPVMSLNQVSWQSASNNFIETLMGFSVTATGIARETRTKLIGAPLGMNLVPKDENVGTSNAFPFGITINSNVQPGTYPLQLEIGGLASDSFDLTVTEAPTPPMLQATDRTDDSIAVWDFGKVRLDKISSIDAALIYINNISTESAATDLAVKPLTNFEITRGLSNSTIEPEAYDYIVVKPKNSLTPGSYTENLVVYNAVTFTSVTLTFIVTEAVTPSAVEITNTSPFSYYPDFTLTWNAPEDDGGSAITSYEVIVNDGEPIIVTENSYSFSVVEGEYGIHSFHVRAINAIGTSLHAAQYSWEYEDYAWARVFVSRTDGNGQTIFHWNAIHPLEGKTLDGYEISTDDGATWGRDYITMGGSYKFCYTGLTNGQTYTVKFRPYYTDGTTGTITTATAAPSAMYAKPVRNLKAEARDGKVILTWDMPEDATDDVTYSYSVRINYDSYHSIPGGTTGKTCTTDGNGHSGTSLVNGEEYVFTVSSKFWDGNFMDRTDSYVVCTPQAGIPDEPGVPAKITHRLNNDGELRITWDAPESDGGSDILYYELGEPSGEIGKLNWQFIGFGEYTFTFPMNDLGGYSIDGYSYHSFSLRAVNAVGTGRISSSAHAGGVRFNGAKTLNLPLGYSSTDAGKYFIEGYEDCIYIPWDEENGDLPEDWDECGDSGYIDYDEFNDSYYSDDYTWSLKTSDSDKITWDNNERKIKVAAGLPAGEYKAVLQAAWWSNGEYANGYNYAFCDFNFTLVVCDEPVIITESLPNGLLDEAYNCLSLFAGIGDVVWSLESGRLPNGLTLSADGEISGVAATTGTFTFTVKATNSAGSTTKELSITIEEEEGMPTETTVIKANNMKLYPNPAVDVLYIKREFTNIDRLEVTDLSGRIVMINDNFTSDYINVSSLETGMYILRLTHEGAVKSVKFTKQ